MHPRRVLATFEKSRVVDDRNLNLFAAGSNGVQRETDCLAAHRSVVPFRLAHHVQQSVVRLLHHLRILRTLAHARRHRLHALALALREQSKRVDRERRPASMISKAARHSRQVPLQPPHLRRPCLVAHERRFAHSRELGQLLYSSVRQVRSSCALPTRIHSKWIEGEVCSRTLRCKSARAMKKVSLVMGACLRVVACDTCLLST